MPKRNLLRLPLALLLFCLPAQAFAAPDAPQQRIAHISSPTIIARYTRFEATFQVQTNARNLQLAYDSTPPAYQAHLFPAEDATKGISVDALFLPPGRSDWAQAEDQPAFWFLGYDANDEPTGEKDWHVRFCPDTAGAWQWRIKVRDATGTALSAPKTLTVTAASVNRGFLRVSPTDRRYIEFGDGGAFLPAGLNTGVAEDTPRAGLQFIASLAAAGAYSLQRVWLGSNGGLQVIGGFANSSGRGWSGSDHLAGASETDAPPNGERFYLFGGGMFFSFANAVQGRSYHFQAWVRPQNLVAGHRYTFNLFQNGAYGSFRAAAPLNNSAGWSEVSILVPYTVAYNHAAPGNQQTFGIGLTDTTAGNTVALDYAGADMTDDATGEPMTDNDSVNYVTAYDPINSHLADQIVEAGEGAAPEQYFTLECFQHEDAEWNMIKSDVASGAADGVSQPDTGGDGVPAIGGLYTLPPGVTYVTADTPTLRFARDFARYAMARWGYSTAVRGFEVVNETDPSSSASVIFDQGVASAFHADKSDHDPLMTSSYWSGLQNEGGALDIADKHPYLDAGVDTGPFLAYDLSFFYNVRGNQAFETGGPNGRGLLQFSRSLPRDARGLATLYDDPGNQQAYLCVGKTIQGRGTWTVSYQYKTSPDVQGGQFYLKIHGDNTLFQDDDPHSGEFYVCPDLKNPATHATANNNAPYATYQPHTVWTTVTRTFTVPNDQPRQIANVTLSGEVTAGSVYFSNVRLTAPNGRDWLYVSFDEPRYNVDYASFDEYMGMSLQDYSGDPSLNMPVDIGETDGYYAGGDMQKAETSFGFDAAANGPRQAAWGLVGAGPLYLQWWQPFSTQEQATGAWRFYAAMQKFMARMPISNGHWRNAEAVSPPGIITIGQKDVVAKDRAYLYIYNRQANWDNLANHLPVSPVSGTILLSGLTPGRYAVTRRDPATDAILGAAILTATAFGLALPIPRLMQDVAVQIAPLPGFFDAPQDNTPS